MKTTLVGIALLAACGTAQAAEDSGVIFGVGAGQSHVESRHDTGFDGTSHGWKAFAGWRFNEYVAVEGAFLDTDRLKHTFDNGLREILDGDLLQASIVGTWPLNEYVSLHARASNNWWDSSATLDFNGVQLASLDATGNDLGWGAGIGGVWDRALFRLEYEALSTDDIDFSLVSLSIAWRL